MTASEQQHYDARHNMVLLIVAAVVVVMTVVVVVAFVVDDNNNAQWTDWRNANLFHRDGAQDDAKDNASAYENDAVLCDIHVFLFTLQLVSHALLRE
jgi:hypothetical protein